ncbi:MAG: anti-sigma regulatory factor [Deltaproteobacteria bacterium]|mgnify:CR=1 FL=1|nr:anti-sigma regulatory factor [Deltaproteobacteria bacterium]
MTRHEKIEVRSSDDVVKVRQRVRALAVEAGFSLVDQTKIITAASELARNTVNYGGGGHAIVSLVKSNGRTGLRLVFEDRGPGITDIELAMQDGYSTGAGLGLGLSGSRRLMHEFEIDSAPGQGTKVTVTRWR